MIEYNLIIDHFYPEAGKLRDILLVHSRNVADMALNIFDSHPELVDTEDRVGARELIQAGAMLHDIGIIDCDAPGIECYGNQPYICHGTIGARMIRNLDNIAYGLTNETKEALARICERHTGTGLTVEQIISRQLPLPHHDLNPETMIEILICYADKFFSKTHPKQQKTFEQAKRSLMKFGEEGVRKFESWYQMFR